MYSFSFLSETVAFLGLYPTPLTQFFFFFLPLNTIFFKKKMQGTKKYISPLPTPFFWLPLPCPSKNQTGLSSLYVVYGSIRSYICTYVYVYHPRRTLPLPSPPRERHFWVNFFHFIYIYIFFGGRGVVTQRELLKYIYIYFLAMI